MSEAKHTPGPFRAGGLGNARIYGPDGMGEHSGPVAEVLHRSNPAERVANKHLFAAAPDLLAALKDILTHGGESADEWVAVKYYRAAQAAIAKAESR